MAVFGYPVAQENDLERAAHAALVIQRSLTELNRKNHSTGKPALAARITIDSGPVVIDAAGKIFGEVPNIAARAQALSQLSTVLTTRASRPGPFVAEERSSHEFKGMLKAAMPYGIVRATGGGHPTTQYCQLITRAVEGLDWDSGEARRALYERARNPLVIARQPARILGSRHHQRAPRPSRGDPQNRGRCGTQVANGTDEAAIGDFAGRYGR